MAYHPAATDRLPRGRPDADDDKSCKKRRLANETASAFAPLDLKYASVQTGEKSVLNLEATLDRGLLEAHLLEPGVRAQLKITIAE